MEQIKNLIIGAGIAGLGASHALKQRGETSLVLEQDETYGGLCGNFEINGFRFDRFVHFSFSPYEDVNEIFNKSTMVILSDMRVIHLIFTRESG